MLSEAQGKQFMPWSAVSVYTNELGWFKFDNELPLYHVHLTIHFWSNIASQRCSSSHADDLRYRRYAGPHPSNAPKRAGVVSLIAPSTLTYTKTKATCSTCIEMKVEPRRSATMLDPTRLKETDSAGAIDLLTTSRDRCKG